MISINLNAQKIDNKVFALVDLNRKGLENVKQLHEANKDNDAVSALLDYYRTRTGIVHPEVNLKSISISKSEQ
ncbi:MAG TPA: heparinase II/III family protein, partial [Paludibacter sp.]|nr:heparinase II/III family protein [Paludibacter sp.]